MECSEAELSSTITENFADIGKINVSKYTGTSDYVLWYCRIWNQFLVKWVFGYYADTC